MPRGNIQRAAADTSSSGCSALAGRFEASATVSSTARAPICGEGGARECPHVECANRVLAYGSGAMGWRWAVRWRADAGGAGEYAAGKKLRSGGGSGAGDGVGVRSGCGGLELGKRGPLRAERDAVPVDTHVALAHTVWHMADT
jgi:hypothetical protein